MCDSVTVPCLPEDNPTILLSTIRSTSKYPMKPSPTAVLLLLTNLRLLDYDNDSEGSYPITPDIFTSLKNKGKAFEHIVYHLLNTLDSEECATVRKSCPYMPIHKKANCLNNTRDWKAVGPYTSLPNLGNCGMLFSNGLPISKKVVR